MRETVGRLRLYFLVFGLAGLCFSAWIGTIYPHNDPATKATYAVLLGCSVAQMLACVAYIGIGARLPKLLRDSVPGIITTIYTSIAISAVNLMVSMTVRPDPVYFLPFLLCLAVNVPLLQQTRRLSRTIQNDVPAL